MPEIVDVSSLATQSPRISPRLQLALTQSPVPAALEEAASFGRWWFEPETSRLVLSATAAHYLSVEAGQYHRLDDCFNYVVSDDLLRLLSIFTSKPHQPINSEFRVINATHGLRWLRLTSLPVDLASPQLISGILLDVTPIKHAAMRERLGFELTEFLVGSHTLGDAVINVIQLICKNLGWDWGAYWALEQSPQGTQQLACKHFWHHPEHDLGSFGQESLTLSMAPGEGLVGSVWKNGEAGWVEDMTSDSRFLRRTSARECRLWSGYVFPVTYVSDDGHHHSPGVLEFYSSLSRQPEAQLPNLSTTIGAFIARMAQRLEQQAIILHLARVDELTGLANRSHFYALLTQACASAARAKVSFGLIFIDLDCFKPINDAFGHEAGNVVLREFAQRLQALAPVGASAGRLGGDEFALLLPGDSTEHMAALAENVLQAARTPFTYDGVEVTVSASIGISTFPENGETSPELLRSADAAMYRIKQNGRNGYNIFSSSSPHALAQKQSSLARCLTIETELHHALHGPELFLAYQPIFDISTERMNAVEALIRWRRPDGTLVPPDVFIPIAEQSHLIVQIGKWVVEQACRDLATLRCADFKNLKVHVNMAASEFMSSTLPQELRALATAFDLDPRNLSLELTEGMLMKRPDQVIPVMRTLRQLGFEISLDDFGMGHSSLALLKNLPISSMKIDRSFVRDLTYQSNDRAIVKTIVELGRQMHLDVIAEGVETASQLKILQQSGCTLIQGFLLSRPLSLADLLTKYPAGRWRQ
ncbi:putative bifunctional diguanylate cyclase/phosphodiesterase [Rhodoferax sp. UBA5149]|uniref:putative bifunctional diguanylate cyclase/phosphodiesterase n=1 Tax=Rhodoferax sp. UBA5149 TaxID=1947379 RepID=UPI0025DB04E2|nr:EAL domain-containing protein [Rhodoferax sp. UBA5149]